MHRSLWGCLDPGIVCGTFFALCPLPVILDSLRPRASAGLPAPRVARTERHNPHSIATIRIVLARLLLRQLPHSFLRVISRLSVGTETHFVCRSVAAGVARYAIRRSATRLGRVSPQRETTPDTPTFWLPAVGHCYYFLQTGSTTREAGPTFSTQHVRAKQSRSLGGGYRLPASRRVAKESANPTRDTRVRRRLRHHTPPG